MKVSWPEVYPAEVGWMFTCGDPQCEWESNHRSEKAAWTAHDKHGANCPYKEEKGEPMPAGPSLIEQNWIELDRVTKAIMDQRAKYKDGSMTPEEIEGFHKLQGQAQGLAMAIQIISVPHFEDVPAVSKWALKRYRMNAGEIDFMDTPGCGGYNPMPLPMREAEKPAPKRAAKPARGPKADPKTGKFRAFGSDEREHLRNMLKKGIPDMAIQSMFKLTDEQFEHEKAQLVGN
ncbi:hypothetical protein TIN4_68 [Tsukamurella phage TIN4]|uniref:Uncharacterized protein n=2 Tax=Tinduovirus TIN3 TaxID=1982571 RepID=A0A0K0N631_9CAUD|nr:hypothetical protein AVT54_gp057 [Tsukamurella phage TIN3]YP_009604198.1 hypothetical protein FDH87_gp057 [Tsukamurella phage TIN4]AKJ71865.1 hypothetical protein TIN3_68 [Tsukamurella phage TIN3]AKJ71974.1 hypothetical protein TIN4_68 [Tsukamurella phage TIN4]